MGSVRRASWKGYLPFLALNVLVSAAVVLLALSLWDRSAPLPEPPPTPTFDIAARLASAVPTVTATIPPSPTPVTYTVAAGDTLGAIAAELGIPAEALMAANGITDPDRLSAGQVLVVPLVETASPYLATALPQQRPSSTPDAPPRIVIRGAYQTGDLQNEFVYLENVGGVAMLAGWTLEDGEGAVYRFPPSFTLYNGGGVNVYTRAGVDSVINLYWGMDRPLWSAGKRITLRNASGEAHAIFEIPSG